MSGNKCRKNVGCGPALLRSIGMAAGAGAAAIIALLLILTICIGADVISVANGKTIGLGIGVIGGIVSGAVAIRKGKRKLLLVGMAPAALLCLISLIIYLSFYIKTGAGIHVPALLCILAGSAAASLFAAKEKRSSRQNAYMKRR